MYDELTNIKFSVLDFFVILQLKKRKKMKTIRNKNGVEALIFAETFEKEAYDQIEKLINFEAYLDSKVRIMPDAHAGKGCTIGTTMTIRDRVTPNLVGVDIGCGMLTIRLRDKDINFELLDTVINDKVPSGFNVHSSPKSDFDFSGLRCKDNIDLMRASLSIGTLGGGNHFIEVGMDEKTGDCYLIIHSGSRKLGGDVCKYYQNIAYKYMINDNVDRNAIITELKNSGRSCDIEKELSQITNNLFKHKDLAYLTGSQFDDYLNDMAIVQHFATVNRETIANIIIKESGLQGGSRFETIHNYIDFDRMILRKGAVSAEKGEMLLIPINMRDGSLLCIGKGNEDWNYSAPHGAGRLMSRNKAKETINMEEFKTSMKDIYTSSVVPETLDEAPQAYKSIEEIKRAITDTVDIIGVIKPIYNFKSH